MRGAPLGAGSRSSPLFITDASHRDNFAAEATALRRVGPSPLRRRVASERYDILSQLLRTSTTLGPRKRQQSCSIPHRLRARDLQQQGRSLHSPVEIQQARGVNTTAPPRHPRHRGNGTVAAGNRTRGGHPSKGHHGGNGTAAGGAKRGNGTAAGGPKRGNGTAAGGAKRGNGTAAGGPKRGNGSANGNAPNNQKNSGAQPNKNGGGSANKPRRPKQIAEETCSSKTSWPEVVGMTGEKARNYILTSMPECNWDVKIIPYGRPVTKDYRTNRVRIFVDTENIVRVLPNIG
ncbi:unnamed protein product [Closterium sp. Naga37s-1]|nr:unnamed protein product [Closterium sp. Naga37s-1]